MIEPFIQDIHGITTIRQTLITVTHARGSFGTLLPIVTHSAVPLLAAVDSSTPAWRAAMIIMSGVQDDGMYVGDMGW